MHLYIYLQQYSSIDQIYIQYYVTCLSENSLGLSRPYSEKGNFTKNSRTFYIYEMYILPTKTLDHSCIDLYTMVYFGFPSVSVTKIPNVGT